MPPSSPLPLHHGWPDTDTYVNSLLNFFKTNHSFQILCGGIHILDFITHEPDIYSSVFPNEWREFFEKHPVHDILDLCMREELVRFDEKINSADAVVNGLPSRTDNPLSAQNEDLSTWRDGPSPPHSLISFIHDIRRHCLCRDFAPDFDTTSIPAVTRNVGVGMRPKKIHEVENFAHYIDKLTVDIAASYGHDITHVVDFGSGQNYLGRALASQPYEKSIIAIESKQLNIDGARTMDVAARLAKKEMVIRNKKLYRLEQTLKRKQNNQVQVELDPKYLQIIQEIEKLKVMDFPAVEIPQADNPDNPGPVQYVFHEIKDGHLDPVIEKIHSKPDSDKKELMVISLHSCGNLVHHGLRSLLLNPSVAAVALVGCCYNLMTEKLGPPTYKVPELRLPRINLTNTVPHGDPHGFPMSKRYSENHIAPNITARCMAVQAPHNWTPKDCDNFFTRHYYRCVFQRILLDRKIISKPTWIVGEDDTKCPDEAVFGGAIIIGSLPKSCLSSFGTYVRASISRLITEPERGDIFKEKLETLSDEEIDSYERRYHAKKKELAITWSLMAFAAGVVESLIVVDRWLFLREQKEVKCSWVEPVFDYRLSPRNLVVCGLK